MTIDTPEFRKALHDCISLPSYDNKQTLIAHIDAKIAEAVKADRHSQEMGLHRIVGDPEAFRAGRMVQREKDAEICEKLDADFAAEFALAIREQEIP